MSEPVSKGTLHIVRDQHAQRTVVYHDGALLMIDRHPPGEEFLKALGYTVIDGGTVYPPRVDELPKDPNTGQWIPAALYEEHERQVKEYNDRLRMQRVAFLLQEMQRVASEFNELMGG